jgi:O-acetyl-ADP-ribose deacetylase (regulator of RNase III)
MQVDAIVNAANSSLLGGGGVDGAIHRAAGPGLLAECKTLGGCRTGEAKITGGYALPAKYVIHTVGPVYRGGTNGERDQLSSCYRASLALAFEHGCESVAFPLISSGAYGYPKVEALTAATEIITEFLLENEMTVYIVVFDKASYEISEELFESVAEYIDDHYADENADVYFRRERRLQDVELSEWDLSEIPELPPSYCLDEDYFDEIGGLADNGKGVSLAEMLSEMDDTFAVTLLKLIDLKGMSDVECYKKANVSKQTWYKIMNEKEYRPSKITVISFAIALELTLEETQHLLSTVGFALSRSSKFDVIIEYFLIKGEYNVFVINETLFKFDQVCLGV